MEGNMNALPAADFPKEDLEEYMKNHPEARRMSSEAVQQGLQRWMYDRQRDMNDPDIDNSITINPEVGKCYEYQYPGEMREKNEWEYAGRFIKRTEFISYNRDNKFLNDHFDNQNYIKDNSPELRPRSVLTDNIIKAKDSNFRVKQTYRPSLFLYRSDKEKYDVFYREVKCRDEYNLLKKKKNLELAKLLLMQSDYTGYEEGITDNILENLEKIYKPDDHWKNKYGISQGNIHEKMERERERDKLIKSRQRLATMRAMNSREGPFRSIRYEPNIMENIGRYLSNMRPNITAQRNMRLEDEYNADGYDADGYDANGYDANGYDVDGYDVDGYDANGYDANDYDVDGNKKGGNKRSKRGRKNYTRRRY